MNTLLHDICYGLRMLLKHRGFTAVAVTALALGIGANTAIFSLVNGILLRPLPYPDSNRIVSFEGVNPGQGVIDSNISFPDFVEWSKQSDLFTATAAYYTGNANLAADNAEPERVPRAGITSNFFSVLGVQPALGRVFRAEEDQPNHISVAIISDGLWKRRFGSDPNIIGKQISLSARLVTVIGVMAPGFDFPEQSQVWTTSALNPAEEPRDNRSVSAIARLQNGIDLTRAQAQISAVNARLALEFPDTNKGWDTRVSILRDRLVREARPALLALLGAVGFVLLIACANVANLLLARASGRQKEVAIRAAMGASRSRLVRQMLTESVLLSAIGGTLGLLLSVWLTDLLRSLLPEGAPRVDHIGIDYRVLVFAIGVSALTGFVFGLVPALHASKLDVSSSLKEGGRTGEGNRRTSARNLLLIGEVALSLVLLVGAGLLIKSFIRLQEVRPGFNPGHVLITSLSLPSAKYKGEQRPEFFRQLAQRLQALPGVEAVGGGINLPLSASNYNIGRAFIPEGRPLTVDESINGSFSTITGDYFRALQIPLIVGRFFDTRDMADTPKAVIVNESVAKRYFGSPQNALGKRLTIWRDEKFPREIVGVVGDTRTSSLLQQGDAQIYVPHAQDNAWNFMALVIRTAGDPAAFANTVRREVQVLDKDQPVYNVRTMSDVVVNSIGAQRLSMQLFTVFAIAALLLAAVGIYGVMAYSVTQRTHEIGIRMALGAQKSDVLRLVIRQGMTLAAIGVVVGLVGAFGLTRVMASLLFSVRPDDPATYLAISFLLSVVAFLACYLPARRAAKLDPVIALSRT
jgi:putative ABC transport system permease protein